MTYGTLDLSVTESHVNEMVDRFDSGLCDPGTSNAVCLALRDQVQLPSTLRVTFQRGRLRAVLGEEWVELPEELGAWLRRAMEGWAVRPRTFRLELPAHWMVTVPTPIPATRPSRSLMAA